MNIPGNWQIGQIGEWKQKWFRVSGRLRFADDESFWDEWCLEFNDGTWGWLEYEDGETFITLKQKLTSPVPPHREIYVGDSLNINGRQFFVVEKTAAVVTGFEGNFPFPVQNGVRLYFVDGNMNGQPASLEWGPDAIEFGVGHLVQPGDLNFNIW
jgi:hypothetical protein